MIQDENILVNSDLFGRQRLNFTSPGVRVSPLHHKPQDGVRQKMKFFPIACRKDLRGHTGDLKEVWGAPSWPPPQRTWNVKWTNCSWGLDSKSAWLWESLTGTQPGYLRTRSKRCLDATSPTVSFHEVGPEVIRSWNSSLTSTKLSMNILIRQSIYIGSGNHSKKCQSNM